MVGACSRWTPCPDPRTLSRRLSRDPRPDRHLPCRFLRWLVHAPGGLRARIPGLSRGDCPVTLALIVIFLAGFCALAMQRAPLWAWGAALLGFGVLTRFGFNAQ